MNAGLSIRRARAGLWGLAVVAAAVVPVFTVVVAAHAGHWAGAGDGAIGLVVPWSGRVWAAVVGLAVAGWAAGVVPLQPGRGRRAVEGATLGGVAAGVCLLGAAPGWVWLGRVGLGWPVGEAALAGSIVAVTGLVAGAAGPAGAGEAGGAALGAAAGGALLWGCWGWFG